MALNLHGDVLEIFKFKETGIVALCGEVVEFFESGEADRRNVDPTSAKFVEGENTLSVFFTYQ